MFWRILICVPFILECVNCLKWVFRYEGSWEDTHRDSFPLTHGGIPHWFGTYHFGVWFVAPINWEKGPENTNTGPLINYYDKMWPIYGEGEAFFVYYILNKYWWAIDRIYPTSKGPKNYRKTSEQTDSGCFVSRPVFVSSYFGFGRHYVFIVAGEGNDYYIREMSPSGKLLRASENNRWKDYNCSDISLVYSVDGSFYFYCAQKFNNDNACRIHKLNPDGTMGVETHSRAWKVNHIHTNTIRYNGKVYFFALSDENDGKHWVLHELLPGGKIGDELHQGEWDDHYKTVFPFVYNEEIKQGKKVISIRERLFFYRHKSTESDQAFSYIELEEL